MSKVLSESLQSTYEELNQERIRLVDSMRHNALKRLDKNTVKEILDSVDSYNADPEDEHCNYFIELALQDPLVVNHGHDPDILHACHKEILVDYAYSNNADYQMVHRIFMGTREGFELSYDLASVLFKMMVSDEYSMYLQSLIADSHEEQKLDNSFHLEQMFDKLSKVRSSNELCRKYNLLIDARRYRSVEDAIEEPLSFEHEEGELVFFSTNLYKEKMQNDNLNYESMNALQFYTLHDDNAFCKLSRAKRDAKNFCNIFREELENDIRENFVVDLSFDHILDVLMQKVA